MDNIIINDKDVTVMSLVHYFVTVQNYNPVIIHGINDEIWLENMESDYKIVRIVSRYIHNNEQLKYNLFRSKQIIKKLKQKTFSFKMDSLNIYVDYGDNVKIDDNNEDKSGLSIFIKNIEELKKNKDINLIFPDIIKETKHKEEGMALLFKISDDINKTNERKNEKMEKIFSDKTPIITYSIILICIAMFMITLGGEDVQLLLNYGANYSINVRNGELYRLITYIFLHGGIVHLLTNMYTLFIVGGKVETFFGKWKYLLIFLLSGVAGGLLSIALTPEFVSVGASGSIFGVFGALLYIGYRYRGYIGTIVKGQILPIILINLVLGFMNSGTDNFCHLGGIVGGLFVSMMIGTIDDKKINPTGLILTMVLFIFLLYLGIFY